MILIEKCSRRFIMDLGKRLKSKRKAKLIRFGLSRGFDYEVIDRCLQRLPGHTDEEAENS